MSAWCYILIFGLLIAFGVSVIAALAWAMRSGQFGDLNAAAGALFDDDPADDRPGRGDA